MASRYRQLSAQERVKIETLPGEGHARNASAKCLARAQATSERPGKLQPEDWERFKACLEEGRNPEQVARRERVEGRTG